MSPKKSVASKKIHQAEAILKNERNYEIIFSPFTDIDGEAKTIVLMRDITEKRRMEAEAARAGHLASIGELAAGVAHEINNPITSIIHTAEILKDQCSGRIEDDEIPGMITKEANRIAKIVKNLLSFARDWEDKASLASVQDILSDSLGLIGKQITKDGIKLSVNIATGLPLVKVRSHEIQQIFLNILSNARYALNKKYSGYNNNKILVIDLELAETRECPFVRVKFHDRGIGISETVIDKIFAPFFSTKPKTEGTGLGLSISYGIVESHGGKIICQSTEGEFTTVIVDLPVEGTLEFKPA